MAFSSGSVGTSFTITDKNTPLPIKEVTLSEIPEEDLPSFSAVSAEYHHDTEGYVYGTSIKTPLNEETSPGESPGEGEPEEGEEKDEVAE